MRKPLVAFVLAAALATAVSAAPKGGFGLDAFNRAVSAVTRGNVVFSPASFEIDCVTFSEAFGALTRAKYAETMGVLNGLESAYKPICEGLGNASSNGVSFIHARAFCLPDERKAHAAYRQWMQHTFAAEAFSFDFKKGAECWFRARMEGEMEGFALPDNAAGERTYSYYDLVSVRCAWQVPFPTNGTREIKFRLADGSEKAVAAMCDTRVADVWVRKHYSALRIAISDGTWFYAVLPNPGVEIRDIRAELSSARLNDFTSGFTSITEAGVSHGPVAVAIPKMDITTESNLMLPFEYFRFPTVEMERMDKNIIPKYIQQIMRFRLDETGVCDAVAEKPADQPVSATGDAKRFILDRPFLFMVQHVPTASIPVVGQFTGQ